MIEQVRAQLPKNLQVAGYDPAYFVGYLNNGFHGIRTSVGYKVFFELRDAIKDLSPATYLQFAEFLSEKGFVGDSKIPLGAGQVRFQYNNVIVHAASLEHALYAEKLGIQFFGNKLAHTGRGIDSYIGDQPQDWHHYLASKRGNINDLSFTTTQYLTFATGASPTSATQTTPAGHTGAQPLNLSTQQKADLAEAQRRADEIITNAKRDAAQYDAQADRIVRDMNGVQAVGRGSNGRGAYSDSAIEAATHDLREQSKYALERGLRESAEVLRLAKLRAGLPTSN
jgi:hypothetical protein